jgi:aspartyl-tRNA(Asn)/glutamyl-tRNA(Gln) amidotransferase subunit A
MYLSDIFTVTANLAGIPAMSLPIGRVGGLPIGGQLLAPHFGESRMLAAAAALERALGDEAHR